MLYLSIVIPILEAVVQICSVKQVFLAVNYYHKALHLGCCSSPRSASVHLIIRTYFTHLKPLFHFLSPLKTSENFWLSDVFRGYRNGTWVKMG